MTTPERKSRPIEDRWGIGLLGAEYDIVMAGTLPPGIVIEVRDYRLAEGAEPGTTVFDDAGKPYFQWTFVGSEEVSETGEETIEPEHDHADD
jgi:hypothetical protein